MCVLLNIRAMKLTAGNDFAIDGIKKSQIQEEKLYNLDKRTGSIVFLVHFVHLFILLNCFVFKTFNLIVFYPGDSS